MATLLLFNIGTPEKKTAIRLTAMRLGISCRDIPSELQGESLDALLSGALSAVPPAAAGFSDEMLVMDSLTGDELHDLLGTLRENGQRVRLKAVVTDHNRGWSATRLHREISAEADAMEKRQRTVHPSGKKKSRR